MLKALLDQFLDNASTNANAIRDDQRRPVDSILSNDRLADIWQFDL